jgi:hypothetical protein
MVTLVVALEFTAGEFDKHFGRVAGVCLHGSRGCCHAGEDRISAVVLSNYGVTEVL